MVTLSNHTCFQDGIFSMYDELKDRYNVYTLSLSESDYPSPKEKNNFYVDAPKKPGITKGTFNLIKLHRMIKIIRKIHADVVYFESSHLWNYPIVLHCKAEHISIAHTINDVIPHMGDSNRGISDFLNRLTCVFSDHVVMRSADGLAKAKKRFPNYQSKMNKVDLWYSFPEYRGVQNRTVLFFGKIKRYKGIDKLLELIQKTPDIQYVVAGKADKTVAETVLKIRQLPNADVIEGVIPHSKMHEFFYNACCVVLPYETATQSGVIIDAYKHSRPAVAFNVGAIGEEIQNGITGFTIAPGDVDALASCIKRIVSMPHVQLEQLCHNAYSYGVDHFSAHSKENEFLTAIGLQ